jgi:hypothetical protein
VRRLAHAHEHDAADALARAGHRDLRDDLAARQLAHEPVTARHAERATHGAADLRRDADAVAGQQHALDGLVVRKSEQQLERVIGAVMLGDHGDERAEALRELR